MSWSNTHGTSSSSGYHYDYDRRYLKKYIKNTNVAEPPKAPPKYEKVLFNPADLVLEKE
jgi:hypothetical protein